MGKSYQTSWEYKDWTCVVWFDPDWSWSLQFDGCLRHFYISYTVELFGVGFFTSINTWKG